MDEVRKILPLFVAMMLVLTGWSGMAHAAEAAGGHLAGIEFAMHAPGDGDEVPADGDKSVPHHHTICHGDDIGQPASVITPAAYAGMAQGLFVAPIRALITADANIAPRPPQA